MLGPLIGVYLDRLPEKARHGLDRPGTEYSRSSYPGPLCIYVPQSQSTVCSCILNRHRFDGVRSRSCLVRSVDCLAHTTYGSECSTSNSTNIGMLIGPAISGLGIALIGAQNVLYVNAGTFFVSVLCLLPIRVRRLTLPRDEHGAPTHLMHEMWEGFRFVLLQHRPVFTLMVTAALYSLASSAFVFMLPVFAKQLLHMGPMELGWLWSALGIGMLCTSAWLAWLNQEDVAGRFRRCRAPLQLEEPPCAG